MINLRLDKLKYNEKGLIPAVVQDLNTEQILMLAYMNKESLKKSIESGETWFYSRSRQKLWHKGATSGNRQKIDEIYYDCDADALLVRVRPVGPACHTGEQSCFYRKLIANNKTNNKIKNKTKNTNEKFNEESLLINSLHNIILARKKEMPEGSYTTYLFEKGIDKILKKVGEEATEVIIAAKNEAKAELIYETADLIYHLLVLMVEKETTPREIAIELAGRLPNDLPKN